MDKLLAIVIPSYNMENYLRRCLDSLLIDNIDNFNKLEVLVINDGSKDSTSAIAHEYETRFPNVFHAIDKENGNYGSCVNRGIDLATAKYFRILDADDFFEKRALEELIDRIESFKQYPDLIITNYQEDFANGFSKYIINDQYEYDNLLDFKDVILGKQKNGYMADMHRMTYKLDVVKKVGLRHLEGISYTDSEYCFYPLREVKTVIFINILLYRYQRDRDGQTVSVLSYQKNIHNLYRIIDRMLNSFTIEEKGRPYYKNLVNVMKVCLLVYYRTILTGRFDHQENLEEMDRRIYAFDQELYHSLNSVKMLRYIPVVKMWRKGWKTNSPCFMLIYRIVEMFAKTYYRIVGGVSSL